MRQRKEKQWEGEAENNTVWLDFFFSFLGVFVLPLVQLVQFPLAGRSAPVCPAERGGETCLHATYQPLNNVHLKVGSSTQAAFYETMQATYSQSCKAGSLRGQKRQTVKPLSSKWNQSLTASIKVCEKPINSGGKGSVVLVHSIPPRGKQRQRMQAPFYLLCRLRWMNSKHSDWVHVPGWGKSNLTAPISAAADTWV